MGIVRHIGSAVDNLAIGDRVVIPFNIACGSCFMCGRGLQSQCETARVREKGKCAAIFGYSSIDGSVPGGQAQLLFKVTDRVIMSYSTAKRLSTSLTQLIRRYEQQFGEIPTQPGQRK